MPRKARCQHLLEKSVHAALSAIEIYNKPDFKYREESFSILLVNAWVETQYRPLQCMSRLSGVLPQSGTSYGKVGVN
jgi:hypothetical protein